MYMIIKCLDGKIRGRFRLQDGTERYEFSTIEEDIEKAKEFAQVCNGTKIKKKDVRFVQEVQTLETKLMPWKP